MAAIMLQHAANVVRFERNQWRNRYTLATLRGDTAEADACWAAWEAAVDALGLLVGS